MKQMYSARDEVDAELVKNALTDEGIDAIVQGGALGGILGAIPVTESTLPSVWVREEDEGRAIAVLAEFQRPVTVHAEKWKCPKCGETIDGQFTACWNCGSAKPEAVLPLEG